MACSPAHCSYNCYSDTCAVNAPTCAYNETNFGTLQIKGDIILASHVNDLRISIDNERTSRRALSEDFPTSVDSDDSVEQQHWSDMKDSVNEISLGAVGENVVTDTYSNLVSASELNNLRTSINTLRVACVCDSECGSHLVCVCHGDCGCHSDVGCYIDCIVEGKDGCTTVTCTTYCLDCIGQGCPDCADCVDCLGDAAP